MLCCLRRPTSSSTTKHPASPASHNGSVDACQHSLVLIAVLLLLAKLPAIGPPVKQSQLPPASCLCLPLTELSLTALDCLSLPFSVLSPRPRSRSPASFPTNGYLYIPSATTHLASPPPVWDQDPFPYLPYFIYNNDTRPPGLSSFLCLFPYHTAWRDRIL